MMVFHRTRRNATMTKKQIALLVWPIILSPACQGSIRGLAAIDGGPSRQDSAMDASSGNDAQAADATLADAGPEQDVPVPDAAIPDAASPDAAQTCQCGDNAYCDESTNTCHCLTGFTDDGNGNCQPDDPGDPAARSRDTMCTYWHSFHSTTATSIWTPGQDDCDPGTLSTDAIADAVSYINGYRYLCGLAPLADDADLNHSSQLCAIIEYRMGHLDHFPPSDAPCYTTEGANAAGSSDLALGTSSPASSVDLFMDDRGVQSLGHRRWIINPSYGPAGVGHAGTATCLYVFSWSNSGPTPDFVAWPNQGFTPISVMPHTWSFSSGTYGISTNTTVTVTRLSDNQTLDVTTSVPPTGYGQPAIAFTPSGWSPQADETYEVSISGLGGGQTVVYQVKPVQCQ